MAKTANIGLNLTEDESTKFTDWRKSIDGNGADGEKSNMQIIDEAIGALQKGGAGDLSNYYTKAEIDALIAEIKYVAIKINSFSANPSVALKGSTVNSVTLSWSLNKNPKTQTLAGATVDATLRSKTITGTFTSYTSWALKVTDEKNAAANSNASISFYNKVFYGVANAPTAYNKAFIDGLANNALKGDHNVSNKIFTTGANQYMYYAAPSSYGTPTFYDHASKFNGGFVKVATFSYTNSAGYAENYDVWKSNNANLGTRTITIS